MTKSFLKSFLTSHWQKRDANLANMTSNIWCHFECGEFLEYLLRSSIEAQCFTMVTFIILNTNFATLLSTISCCIILILFDTSICIQCHANNNTRKNALLHLCDASILPIVFYRKIDSDKFFKCKSAFHEEHQQTADILLGKRDAIHVYGYR